MSIEKPQPDAIEQRDLRSIHSKTFSLANGERQVVVRQWPEHYISDQDELRTIDTTVKQVDGRVFADWMPYRFALHETGIGFSFQSRDAGFAQVTLAGIGGEDFDSDATLTPTIGGSTITFSEVRPGCDIAIVLLPDRVKTLRIVKDAKAPRAFEWLCEHDADGRDMLEDALLGTDAAGRELELSTEVLPIDAGSYRCKETWSGRVNRRDPKTRIKTPSHDVAYPVEIDPTVSAGITNANDDGSQFGNAQAWYSGITRIGFSSGYGMDLGIRWASVAVPQGVTITSASVTVNCTIVFGGSSATGFLYGVAADNSATWSSGIRVPSTVAKTTAKTTVPALTTGVKVYDTTAVVQEIVNRAGFVSGNAMAIAGIHTNTTTGYAYFTNFTSNHTNEPTLSITYSTAPPSRPKSNMLLGVG